MAPNGVRSQRWPVQRSGPPPVYFADGSGWGSVPAAILVDHTEDENLVGAQTHERFIDDVLDKFSRGGCRWARTLWRATVSALPVPLGDRRSSILGHPTARSFPEMPLEHPETAL